MLNDTPHSTGRKAMEPYQEPPPKPKGPTTQEKCAAILARLREPGEALLLTKRSWTWASNGASVSGAMCRHLRLTGGIVGNGDKLLSDPEGTTIQRIMDQTWRAA